LFANVNSQGKTVLEADLPIVDGKNQFMAYAFSKSDVKSADGTLTVTGAASMKRGGVGYILAIGVSEYANKDYDLKYAMADVKEFA
jgi:hypothetical protein